MVSLLVGTLLVLTAVPVRAQVVAKSISTGGAPEGLAFDSSNGDFYVAMAGATVYERGSVFVLQASTNTVVASVAVGDDPFGVALDPANGDMYVTNLGSGSVSVIQSSTNTVVANVSAGYNPDGIAFDPVNGNVYVLDSNTNGEPNLDGVSIISTSTNTLVGYIGLGTPQMPSRSTRPTATSMCRTSFRQDSESPSSSLRRTPS